MEVKGAGFYSFIISDAVVLKLLFTRETKVLSFPPQTAIGCRQLFGNIN